MGSNSNNHRVILKALSNRKVYYYRGKVLSKHHRKILILMTIITVKVDRSLITARVIKN